MIYFLRVVSLDVRHLSLARCLLSLGVFGGSVSNAFTTFAATDAGVCLSFSSAMTLASQIGNAIAPASVPVHRWQTAEAASSAASSATCYERSEHIIVLAVVMAEGKFGQYIGK